MLVQDPHIAGVCTGVAGRGSVTSEGPDFADDHYIDVEKEFAARLASD
ncbi:hypothetical protein [Microbacterium cremeum]|nr:hypothetical protein [Microbacterium cremeum]